MQNQTLATTTQNSLNQYKEQRSLLTYTNTEEERLIVNSIEKSQLLYKVDVDVIVNLIVKWRLFIGIPKSDVAEEIAINVEFIRSTYGHLTVAEIELAIRLSILRKLPDTEFFGYFSPMYIAKVLDSYLYYRKMTMADSIRRRDKAIAEEQERKNRPTPEQQAENTKELFANFYQQWKEKGEIFDVFNICYNFLRKHNLMEVPKPMIAEAQEYGKKKVKELREKTSTGKIDFSTEMEEKRFARNYCVQKYFEQNNINVILNNIKPHQFS